MIQANPESYILIVEDSIDLREIYKECLIYAGFTVKVASDGLEALNLINSLNNLPGVILLDLMMPVMDGWQFLKEIEKDTNLQNIPILVCSALADGLPVGYRSLGKPVSQKTLISAVAEFASSSKKNGK